MSSKVVLSGMEFHAYHGVYAEEGRFGARFIVDAELHWDFAGLGDDLEKSVNYEQVYAAVEQEVTATRVRLIEVLAGNIASRLLREQPLLGAVTVRVHKPHAPLPGIVRDVSAELTLNRTEVGGGRVGFGRTDLD